MKPGHSKLVLAFFASTSLLALAGCSNAKGDPGDGEPPAARVVGGGESSLFAVEHPEQFPVVAAVGRLATSELVVTGTVTPDVSRNVPVVSLASGRVLAVHARLGDTVQKGQLLLTVRSDNVSGCYSNYRKAITDEVLARAQLERAKDLHEHGAMSLNDLQVAQDVEDKAKVDVETMAEHLRLLGTDPNKPQAMVEPLPRLGCDHRSTGPSRGIQAFNSGVLSPICPPRVSAMCENVGHGPNGDRESANAYPDRTFKPGKQYRRGLVHPHRKSQNRNPEPGLMRLDVVRPPAEDQV